VLQAQGNPDRQSLLLVVSALALGLGVVLAETSPSWKTYRSREGGFEVSLPGTPKEERKEHKTANGKREVVRVSSEPRKGEGIYLVAFSDHEPAPKPETDDQKLDRARDAALALSKGRLLEEKKLTLQQHTGREVRIEVEGKVIVRARLFVVKKRLYQVMVVGPKETADSKDTQRFLDSFQFIK
jgi:hypothetical protein